ncbi:MAG: DUF4143 domain-containing protein [Caldilineales bacterium]|nr:DUF4143 domain-containing protein [Caldilineales bacterium]
MDCKYARKKPALYFWRTAAGSEVDVIVEHHTRLIPLEIKTSATPRPDMAREIAAFQRDFGNRAAGGYVVHPGRTVLPLGGGALAWPLATL